MSVINIIGIDDLNKIVYGIGNNKKAYMKYLIKEQKWYSILPEVWKNVNAALSSNNIIQIENGYSHSSAPETVKQHDSGNGEKWGGYCTAILINHFTFVISFAFSNKA